MTYSEIVNNGSILPFKEKYTVRDCKALQVNSLFKSGGTLSNREAGFILICSAIFHNTTWSKGVTNFKNNKIIV